MENSRLTVKLKVTPEENAWIRPFRNRGANRNSGDRREGEGAGGAADARV